MHDDLAQAVGGAAGDDSRQIGLAHVHVCVHHMPVGPTLRDAGRDRFEVSLCLGTAAAMIDQDHGSQAGDGCVLQVRLLAPGLGCLRFVRSARRPTSTTP